MVQNIVDIGTCFCALEKNVYFPFDEWSIV